MAGFAAALGQGGFDNRHVLLDRASAYAHAPDQPPLVRERHAPSHRGVSAPCYRAEWKERLSWLHQRQEVGCPRTNERRRVGFALGNLERKDRRPGHTMLQYDVPVNVDDTNGDWYFAF